MLRPNNVIHPIADYKVMFRRWSRPAGYTSLASAIVFLAIALATPLVYESQIIIERKPAKLSADALRPDEFDVARLTSETQRSVTILKSRYLMERWLDALSTGQTTGKNREGELRRLYASLIVQPVNYTDVLIIRVRAKTPDEAMRRGTILIDLFHQWDTEQNKQQATDLIRLLTARSKDVETELLSQRKRLHLMRRGEALILSGSEGDQRIETELGARAKVYEALLIELDRAQRELMVEGLERLHVLTPARAPAKPLHSRFTFILLAMCSSLVMGLGTLTLLECFASPGFIREESTC